MSNSSTIGRAQDLVLDQLDTSSLFSEVLLVEDDLAHANLIIKGLKGIVGQINHVTNAEEAIQALESSLPELVLTDLKLPDVSGTQLLRTVRNVRPNLPVIVLTSSGNLDDAVSAMRDGAWDYMVKEFTASFREQIDLLVRRVGQRRMQQVRELQARAERDAFWSAVQTAQDGVAILESSGNVVFGNDMFLEFCRTAGSLVDKRANLIDVINTHDPNVADGLRSQLQNHGENRGSSIWRSEFHIGSDEEGVHFELSLTSFGIGGALRANSSLPIMPFRLRQPVVWVRDITSKKAQERFQRDILATTSHDLKGPLGAILTSSELLDQYIESDDSRVRDLLTRVGSCARNCITLIDELLSARRIQDGLLVVNPRWYSASELLEDIVLDFLPIAKAKSIHLHYRPPAESLKVFADRIGIHRVLGNLVSNALKFTPRDGEVEVIASERGSDVQISVRDTGCGIEADACNSLFQRYTRLDKHQDIDGTGLGLFVTKSIVDAHNGSLEVKSKVGVGTTITAIFPAERVKNSES